MATKKTFKKDKLIISIDDIITNKHKVFIIDLGNRVNYTFVPTDFTTHHHDIDGDTLVSVFLFGSVNTITFNNNPYVANTEVFFTDIQAGKLKHIAPDINNYIESLPDYKVKDSLGNIII